MSKAYLYEAKSDDFLLEEDEEKIMRAMRKLNKLWKDYKSRPGGNRLILFTGGTGCSIRIDTPSADNVLETYASITCDGGDGGDYF